MTRILIAAAILAVMGSGVMYGVKLIRDNEKLAGQVRTYQEDIEGFRESQTVLMNAYTENYDEKAKLENMLADHDLGALAKKKPGLVVERINAGTIRMFESIETASRDAKPPEASTNTH